MRIALIAALIILLNGVFSFWVNLPEEAGLDVPDGKLNSLSFAPFREGQNPLLLQFPTPEQIDEDLNLLADKTHTIRTYSIAEGMAVIPELARKHGLEMILGAWVGYYDYLEPGFDDVDARIEIEGLVSAANAYPDVVKRVIVGNEVLLRGDRKPQELIKYIREVKQRVKQPVSYADVWSMYMKYPELIKEVDFITIHILPYWEDEPIPVDKAPAHIERIYKQVKAEADAIAPGKPILIGESGWPSEGRQRGWAIPSVVNEAKFIRGLLKVATDNHFDVNIVEAFNQPWKSELEGVVGANWGLFSVDRKEVFPLTGNVYENIKWLDQFVMAALIMVLIVLCYAKKLQPLPLAKTVFFLVLVQVLCAVLVYQADKSWYTSYDNWQRVKTVLTVILNIAVAGLVLNRTIAVLRQERLSAFETAALDRIYLLVVGLALYKTYLLASDGRYVSFPFELAAIPTLGLVGLFVAQCLSGEQACLTASNINTLLGGRFRNMKENHQIAWLICLYSVGLVVGEIKAFMIGRDFIASYPSIMDRLLWSIKYTLSNGQLLAWLACLVILAIPFLGCSLKNGTCRKNHSN